MNSKRRKAKNKSEQKKAKMENQLKKQQSRVKSKSSEINIEEPSISTINNQSEFREELKYSAPQVEKQNELNFTQKLEIWTNGFTEPVLDIRVILSENKKAPKFSGIEEYTMYEKIKAQYNQCLTASKNDVAKAWKLFRAKYLQSRDLSDEER